jgi:YD repeat-containing protein
MSYNPPSLGAGTWSTSYAYNIDGDVTKVVRPTGDTIAFNYDNAGRTSSLSFSRGTLATGTLTLGYGPATGKLTSVTNSVGSSLALTYNGALPTTVGQRHRELELRRRGGACDVLRGD